MTNKPYDLIIFDWDGTLIDSVGRIVSSMRAAAELAELPVPSEDAVKGIIGLSLPAVYEILFPGAHPEQLDALKQQYRTAFVETDPTPTPLFDGARETLDWLKDSGFVLAVATGKARYGLERAWKEVALDQFFHTSRCSDEAEGKPHPQMVLDILKETDTPAQRALVVGDTGFDMEMAKRANVDRLAATYGAHDLADLLAHEPLDQLHDIQHLPQWLKTRP
ncbi:HAD-IA family hydrolase [Permianibacter sp. IMCC34836]|uniref:HAD-IA family hydrolase n=1 Tax=Permianibacter fluminis TaxID=2738515 RepID=UPI001553F593|nr:HAD-IA family hydrolase [Permianibacter fluminis]NQD37662.1 HAD-IA family hydrolase [Permianibacter fluminis]